MLADGQDARFTFDAVLAFRTLGTGSVELRATAVQVGQEVRLTAEVDVPGWERLYDAGCFHLDEEPAPLGFEAQRPVRIELRLRPRVVAAFDDPEALVRALLGDEVSPVRHTEAWYALEVIQRLDVPGDDSAFVDIGIRTRFAAAG